MTYPVPLSERVEKSAYICTGRVIEQTPFLASDGNVQTLNTIEISAWLKGHSDKAQVGVVTLGGVLGDRATLVEPSLQVDLNGEYLFFLQNEDFKKGNPALRSAQPALPQLFPYAENQGALTYQFGFYNDLHYPGKQNEAAVFAQISGMTRLPVLKPDGSPAEPRQPDGEQRLLPITGFSPSPTNAGTIVPGDFITITGSGFGAAAGTVFFTNADDGGATFTSSGVASDNVSWSDNSITVKVARRAGTGPINVNGAMTSGSNLNINYSHLELNSNFSGFGSTTRQRYYHRNLNGTGGYSFKYNNALPTAGTSMDANAAAKAAFERAVTSWACSTGINWKTDGATATGASGVDGMNVVLFDNTLSAGILGQAVSNFSGSSQAGCNLANTVWWVADIDIKFKPDPPTAGFPWEYGPAAPAFSEFDFESVAVHELGHAHGLGHRIAAGEVMHFGIANGSSIRTPSATEITGGTARVTYSQAATCFNPTNSGTPMLPLGALAITCPANVTVTAPYSLADFAASATASGGCGTITKTQSPAAGTNLAVGGHTVTLTATDGDGATATCTFSVFVTPGCPATGSVWYVDAAAASGGNGASWACAFQNLQDAIDAASSGQEIWVKAGTYFPTKDPSGNASPADPRDKTFYLKNGVKVYGGFVGTETALSQRDWANNVTILSGDFNGDDVGFTNNSENAYHVAITVTDLITTQLDGFTIKGGNANGSSSITVESKGIFRDVGGGLYNHSSATAVKNCTFSTNSAITGGGAYHTTATSTYDDCLFSTNSVTFNGGGSHNSNSTLTYNRCTFSGNTAGSGGGMRNETNTIVTLSGCVFKANSATTSNGGGFYIGTSSTSATMTNCLFSGNSSTIAGGGMYNSGAAMTLMNCTVSGNKTAGTINSGGGIAFLATNPTVTNCVVWNNREGSTTGSATANLYLGSSTPVITYSLIQNHNPSGTGNLNGIPNAANSNYPNFVTALDPATAPSTAGDFHITSCSPVLNLGTNTGAPTTDLFGNARPFGTTVDMGVHELQAAAAAPPSITCPANQTATEPYTLADFTALASTSGTCTPITVAQNPAIGTSLAVGTHTITLTATASNGSTATCTFTVTVNSNCPATGTIWYVNPSAASGGNGASWACAFQNLQDAINAASSGHEIWVKAGTYFPTKDPSGNASPADPRDKVFYLKNGVAVYGGFTGTETARTQRNWTSNPTILSGDIGTANAISDNCYHVVLSVSDANTTVLDGFNIEKGNANGTGSLTVESKTIPRNQGGGAFNQNSAVQILNCRFSANSADSSGAGMFNGQ